MQATETIHCFEKAGLGKAPFSYVGEVFQDIRYGNRVIGTIGGCTVETKPGGTCDYCGTYIVNMFRVKSADGNEFKVGCDCVKKTGDAGLIRKVNDAVKKMNSERREAKRVAKIVADREFCLSTIRVNLGTLSSLPHPSPTMAEMGRTMGDYAAWMLDMRHYETLALKLREALKS